MDIRRITSERRRLGWVGLRSSGATPNSLSTAGVAHQHGISWMEVNEADPCCAPVVNMHISILLNQVLCSSAAGVKCAARVLLYLH